MAARFACVHLFPQAMATGDTLRDVRTAADTPKVEPGAAAAMPTAADVTNWRRFSLNTIWMTTC